jgi:diguanylate cyclase (GGDEF)-like protein
MKAVSPPPIRKVLVVDDDIDNRVIVSKSLGFEGYLVDTAMSGEEALEKLEVNPPHLVLLDVNMSGISGIETLKIVRQRPEYVSVMLVTAQSGTDDVIAGLDAGADDYIRKPFHPTELLARVRAQFRIKDLNDQLKVANLRLQELVDHDDLTGLFNMRNLYERLDMELIRARRFGRPVGVVMMDMDHFKDVNDQHDHLFGSHVLTEVGQIIRDNIRQVDFAARYGGDEFLIVLCETSIQGAQLFAERLRSVIEGYHFANAEHATRLTSSLGIAVAPTDNSMMDARTLVRAADQALYMSKEAGRNCAKFYDFVADPKMMKREGPAPESLRGAKRARSS